MDVGLYDLLYDEEEDRTNYNSSFLTETKSLINTFIENLGTNNQVALRAYNQAKQKLLNAGFSNEDVNNFVPVLNYDSTNPSSLINISKDYMHQKKFNKALTYITLFLKCFPNSFEGYYIKSQIYTKLYRGNKALVLLNKALTLLKNQEDLDHIQEMKILNCRGKCLIFLKRFDEAIETYKTLNAYNEDSKNYLKIGVCNYNKKNLEEAINIYNKRQSNWEYRESLTKTLRNNNIPFGFTSNDIICILAIEFREFISDAHNTIRKCHNCGMYFIPQNLKSTKYCDSIFENGKTCREIGKETSYKELLKNDALLDLYRKRYMSLASSNSHYHTEKSQKKFEKYKSEGPIMKEKYMKGEISKNEFKKWIEESYQ